MGKKKFAKLKIRNRQGAYLQKMVDEHWGVRRSNLVRYQLRENAGKMSPHNYTSRNN